MSNGKDSFAGVTAGLGPEGLFLVKRESGQVVTVIAGDVTEISSTDTRVCAYRSGRKTNEAKTTVKTANA